MTVHYITKLLSLTFGGVFLSFLYILVAQIISYPIMARKSVQSSSASQARYEKELKSLASQAKRTSPYQRGLLCVRASTIAILLALAAYTSQLSLAPVYGGIPSARLHGYLVGAGCFAGWAGNEILKTALSDKFTTAQIIPVLTLYMPLLQCLMEQLSGFLGAKVGPIITETVTLMPLVAISSAAIADALEQAKFAQMLPLPSFVADSLPGLASWCVLKWVGSYAPQALAPVIGRFFLFTTVGLQLLVAGLQAIVAPSMLLVLALPALLHTAVFNVHVNSPNGDLLLNNTLTDQGWLLLDRQQSITGYVSVLENRNDGYRVMRCDHSLLGGEWIEDRGDRIAEPIYGVFAMLEAVRLVERTNGDTLRDDEAKALVM